MAVSLAVATAGVFALLIVTACATKSTECPKPDIQKINSRPVSLIQKQASTFRGMMFRSPADGAGADAAIGVVNGSLDTLIDAAREHKAGGKLAEAKCSHSPVNFDDLRLGLQLGSQFLVKSQRQEGNFRYQYNWISKSELKTHDNAVRQAGTLWGLSMLHNDDPSIGLMSTIRRGLKYMEQNSREFPGGVRLLLYPGGTVGHGSQKLGAVALLALSLVEVLRRPEALESAAEEKKLQAHLAGYLRGILAARTSNHTFQSYYNEKTGKPSGSSSPFYDGEILLLLVKAAKYLGRHDLWPEVKAAAEAGWQKWAEPGLKLSSSTHSHNRKETNLLQKVLHKRQTQEMQQAIESMQGYYQWGTMAWYELLGVKDAEFSKYASRILRYTDPIVRRKSVWSPNQNSAHVLEGIIPAFVTAVQLGDQKHEQKYACAIRQGMEDLHSLQVGHKRAYNLAEPIPEDAGHVELDNDELAQGGAQFVRKSADLRIDTTQHHLHALLMAKRLVKQQPLI